MRLHGLRIAAVLFSIMASSAHTAQVTRSISGDFIECSLQCFASGVSVGGSIAIDFTFDDSLYGTNITNISSIDADVTFDVSSIGVPSPLTLDFQLSSINLEIGNSGTILGGTAEASSSFFAAGSIITLVSSLNLSTLLSPLGTVAHMITSDRTGGLYLSAACFDGYNCSAVPVPAAAWLFASALCTCAGLRSAKTISSRWNQA